MRIVAGTARGRRLVTPRGLEVRPTTDRVREAVFNSLASHDLLVGATVLDLFAGSGALGIEALSRGAAHATFVDASRESIDAVRRNLDTTGHAADATVVRSDALRHLEGDHTAVDLALLDPPYAFEDWALLLVSVRAGAVVIESDRAVDPGPRYEVLRERRYGGTVVTIARSTDRGDHGRDTPEART